MSALYKISLSGCLYKKGIVSTITYSITLESNINSNINTNSFVRSL